MGCKATNTGVLMKWLVCASVYMYVLLFGVLNSNKVYLLAFLARLYKVQVELLLSLCRPCSRSR